MTVDHRQLLSGAPSSRRWRLWAEYEAFTKRDLSEYRIVYVLASRARR